MWDVEHNSLICILEGHNSPIVKITLVEKTATLVTVSVDNALKVWDLTKKCCEMTFVLRAQDHQNIFIETNTTTYQVLSVGIEDSKSIYRIWNYKTGHLESTIIPVQIFGSRPFFHRFCANASKLVVGCITRDECMISVWDVAKSEILYEPIFFAKDQINTMTCNEDGSLLYCGLSDGEIYILQTSTNIIKGILRCTERNAVRHISLSDDEKTLICSTDTKICIWDLPTKSPPLVINSPHQRYLQLLNKNLLFSISSTSINMLQIWDLHPLKSLRVRDVALAILHKQKDAEKEFEKLPHHVKIKTEQILSRNEEIALEKKALALDQFIAEEYLPEIISLLDVLCSYETLSINTKKMEDSFEQRFISLPDSIKNLAYNHLYLALEESGKVIQNPTLSAKEMQELSKKCFIGINDIGASYKDKREALKRTLKTLSNH